MHTAMIVDDSAFMRKLIRQQLEALGFSIVCEVGTGRDAVNGYPYYKPALVTMDVTLPDMNGIAATAKIAEMDPSATVVMVSAMGQQALIIEALQAGARDFVVKPFTLSTIQRAVEKALGQTGHPTK